MKILVTSIGNKIPLIECIKKTSGLFIIGADINAEVMSKYFVDEFWQMPRLNELQITDFIKKLQQIECFYVLPTREEDLKYFSRYQEELKNVGINVLVSSLDAINIVTDKYLFSTYLKKLQLKAIPTFLSLKEITLNNLYVVKERYGAGSKNLYLNLTKDELQSVLPNLFSPIIQPMIDGTEYSIDLYITKTKKVKAVIVRKRTLVIDGESQITEIIDHPKLEKLICRAALALNLEGHVMFQAIEDKNGELWIIECNARIGGASTLSIYAGLDTFNWWIAECNGETIDDSPVEIKELKQIRYKKDLII